MSFKILAAITVALSLLCGPVMAQEYFSPGQAKKQEQPAAPSDLMSWFKKSVEDSPDIQIPDRNMFVATCTDMTLTATIGSPHTVQSVLFIVDSWAPDERLTGVAVGGGVWSVDWVMPCNTDPDHNYKVKVLAVDSRGEYTVAVQWIFLRS